MNLIFIVFGNKSENNFIVVKLVEPDNFISWHLKIQLCQKRPCLYSNFFFEDGRFSIAINISILRDKLSKNFKYFFCCYAQLLL